MLGLSHLQLRCRATSDLLRGFCISFQWLSQSHRGKSCCSLAKQLNALLLDLQANVSSHCQWAAKASDGNTESHTRHSHTRKFTALVNLTRMCQYSKNQELQRCHELAHGSVLYHTPAPHTRVNTLRKHSMRFHQCGTDVWKALKASRGGNTVQHLRH